MSNAENVLAQLAVERESLMERIQVIDDQAAEMLHDVISDIDSDEAVLIDRRSRVRSTWGHVIPK